MSTDSDEILVSPYTDESSSDESETVAFNVFNQKCTSTGSRLDEAVFNRYSEDFEHLEILGEGGYGIVAGVKHKLDNQKYAIKRVLLSTDSSEENELAFREVRIMSGLSHPNIVRYYSSWIQADPLVDAVSDEDRLSLYEELPNDREEASKDSCISFRDSTSGLSVARFIGKHIALNPYSEPALYIQMELGRENLRNWLLKRNEVEAKKKNFWSLNNLRKHLSIFTDIVTGLDYLHMKGIIHRDIKPENIIFREDSDHVFLTDFGLAKSIENHEFASSYPTVNTGPIGTPVYAAPEIETELYDTKVDIFSLGIVLMELVCEFYSMSERASALQNFKNYIRIDVRFTQANWRNMADIILEMTNPDPSERPNAFSIHKYALYMLMHVNRRINETATSEPPLISTYVNQRKMRKKQRIKRSAINSNMRSKHKPSVVSCNTTLSRQSLLEKYEKLKKKINKLRDKKKYYNNKRKSQCEKIGELKTELLNVKRSGGIS